MPRWERIPNSEAQNSRVIWCASATLNLGTLSDFGIREAIAKVAPLWHSRALFPLTPALSLREREHHRPRIRQPEPLRVVAGRTLVLPLPQGEGKGEGKRALETADSGSFAIGSRSSNFLHARLIHLV